MMNSLYAPLIEKIYPSEDGKYFTLPEYDSIPVDVPDWDTYFFYFAYIASLRSKDANTKCGAVVVNNNNHIIGTGYNSFARGLPDHILPNTRPEKYEWFSSHAEINAILNSEVVVRGSRVYVTGPPCFSCLNHMVQVGINAVYAATNISKIKMIDEAQNRKCSILSSYTGLKVHLMEVDFSFLTLPQ